MLLDTLSEGIGAHDNTIGGRFLMEYLKLLRTELLEISDIFHIFDFCYEDTSI